MSRPRKPSIAATSSNAFADALKFCALILKDHGAINETHVHIKDKWITAFNGILAVGHKCDNDIFACPQIKLTLAALSKCGQNIAITQLDNNRLSIKSDKFKAIIPCVATDLIEQPVPDPPIAVIDNRLKDAFGLMLDSDNSQTIYSASVLLNGESLISSLAGAMLIEYWHGINLPIGLVIPKTLIVPITKINKKLTGFGFSSYSVTFHFEDESWIRSQLYAEQWPDISHIFDCKSNAWPFPADFFAGVAAVAPFGEGMVYLTDERLRSHAQEGAGAEFEAPGMQGSWCYPAKQLTLLQPWATHVDFQAEGANGIILYAAGKNARAVIAGVKQAQPLTEEQRKSTEDEIPF